MFFSDKSDLKFLHFKSREPYFSFAQIEWNGLILNQQDSCDLAIVDLSQENLTELVFNLYSQLSFIETCELYHCLSLDEISKDNMDWKLYFQKSQMQFNDRFIELSETLMKTTLDFRNWCQQRKASSQDLMPLNALSDLTVWNDLSLNFSKLNISRNDGKQIIDLLTDLLLLKTDPSFLKPQDNQVWLEKLLKLRQPQTLKSETQNQNLKNWPQYVQLQKQRQGDRILQKIQITFTDKKDLNEKLSRLSSMELS